MKRAVGSNGDGKGSTGALKGMVQGKSGASLAEKEKASRTAELVQTVMGTSGGDNAELARKIHSRFDRCAPVVWPLSRICALLGGQSGAVGLRLCMLCWRLLV